MAQDPIPCPCPHPRGMYCSLEPWFLVALFGALCTPASSPFSYLHLLTWILLCFFCMPPFPLPPLGLGWVPFMGHHRGLHCNPLPRVLSVRCYEGWCGTHPCTYFFVEECMCIFNLYRVSFVGFCV